MQHKKLNLFEKGQVVALVANGESYRSVSRKMGVNDKTISRVWKNYKENRRIERKYGSGRKKNYSPQMARQIRRWILSGKCNIATDVYQKLKVSKLNGPSIPTILSYFELF